MPPHPLSTNGIYSLPNLPLQNVSQSLSHPWAENKERLLVQGLGSSKSPTPNHDEAGPTKSQKTGFTTQDHRLSYHPKGNGKRKECPSSAISRSEEPEQPIIRKRKEERSTSQDLWTVREHTDRISDESGNTDPSRPRDGATYKTHTSECCSAYYPHTTGNDPANGAHVTPSAPYDLKSRESDDPDHCSPKSSKTPRRPRNLKHH